MKKLGMAVLVGLALVGCGKEYSASTTQATAPAVPSQAKAWCQYNAFENQANRDNYNRWEASNPHKNAIPQKNIERMADEIRPKLKAERDRLFGPMSDVDFGVVMMKSIRENWYQKYCDH